MLGLLSFWQRSNHKISLGYLFVQLLNSVNFISAICVPNCLSASFETNYFGAERFYESPTCRPYVSETNYNYCLVTHKLYRLWQPKLLRLFFLKVLQSLCME